MRQATVIVMMSTLFFESSRGGDAPRTKRVTTPERDLAACFQFPPDRKASAAGCQKAMAYLQSLSKNKTNEPAIQLVCPDKPSLPAALKAAARRIRIDGEDGDWAGVPVAAHDPPDNVVVHHAHGGKPVGPPLVGMDIAGISYVYTDEDLFLRFKMYGEPETTDVAYWLEMDDNDGERLYSLVLSQGRIDIHRFKEGKFDKAVTVARDKGEVRIKNVVEARIARSELPGLPDTFRATASSYHQKWYRVNWVPRFRIKPLGNMASTTPAYLLARYAERADLQTAGLVPLALSLTESHIFENAVPSLRETIIQDGVAMIAASRKLSGELSRLPFEAVLAWCNRGLVWGTLLPVQTDERGLITREAYKFMFLEPDILTSVRGELAKQKITPGKPAVELARAVDTWALGKNQYRWKLEVLEEWAKSFGGDWPAIHRSAKEDVRAGRDKICTVNGVQVYYYAVMSPNVQWRWYQKHGRYYGACADVAVITMLAFKALGIPDICFFRRFGKQDASIHTFAGYFDQATNTWRSPQWSLAGVEVKGASVLQWSLPPLTERMPEYAATPVGGGSELFVSDRSPYLSLSPAKMQQKLSEGFTNAQFRDLLYAQVKEGAAWAGRRRP
jgi:hypothetical protein